MGVILKQITPRVIPAMQSGTQWWRKYTVDIHSDTTNGRQIQKNSRGRRGNTPPPKRQP